ncbi:hypothetical protein D3C77_632550 [compost metagenome]
MFKPFQADIAAFQLPDATQGIGQLLAGGIGQVDGGLPGGDRKFLACQLAVRVQRPRHRHARQCNTRNEPSSRNRH